MRNKIMIAIFSLCIPFILGSSWEIEVCANEKETASDITIEYNDYSIISESIQSESGATMHLVSIENIEGVYQAVYRETNISQELSDQSISPHIIVSSEKEVIKTYSTFDEIPSSISYEEYNNSYNIWMSGTLFLKKAEQLGSGWTATYKGTLIGNL